MSENDAISRISDIPMPEYYLDYYSSLSNETFSVFEHAASAKSSLTDSSGIIEPKIAFDLATAQVPLPYVIWHMLEVFILFYFLSTNI